jgi:hypothetical protein
MTRPALPSPALPRLLEAAGYRLERRTEMILAARPRDHRAILIVAAPRSPAELERLFPSDAVHRTIVYDDDPGTVARSVAADRGMEVLDPTTLGAALGELLLPPPAEPKVRPAPDDDPTGALEAPFGLLPEGQRIVRPRIDRAEAELLAGVDGSRFTLRLVPFYVAAYRVRTASPHGEAGPVLRHLVAVNALARTAEVWDDQERDLVDGIAEPHQRLAPQLTPAQAGPIAVEAIRRRHTVHVDHTEQHGGALVIETRRIPPSEDDLRLGPFSLLFVPHWYAEGGEGRVVLDAVTGRRTSVELPALE